VAYFEDLSPCDYFGDVKFRLLAVGWLDPAHRFPKGRVSRTFFDSLAQLLATAWEPFTFAGRHHCEFCVFTGGPGSIPIGTTGLLLGGINVFVPGDEAVYVAPSLILHYIDAHEYLPPELFVRAVEACPPMRSIGYLKALRQHGIGREWPKKKCRSVSGLMHGPATDDSSSTK
jgi:hypothetical protein